MLVNQKHEALLKRHLKPLYLANCKDQFIWNLLLTNAGLASITSNNQGFTLLILSPKLFSAEKKKIIR